MSPSERQYRLLEVLCQRRYDKIDNLAQEFNVCRRTIRRDLAVLMCSFPIETVRGRYGGDVQITEGFYTNRREHKMLNAKQIDLLRKLSKFVSGGDLDTLNSILAQFTPDNAP